MQNHDEVWTILACVGPFWGAVTLISLTAIGSRYYAKRRSKQLGYNRAMEAFRHGATVAEVERLLWAWNGNAEVSNAIASEMTPPPKPMAISSAYNETV